MRSAGEPGECAVRISASGTSEGGYVSWARRNLRLHGANGGTWIRTLSPWLRTVAALAILGALAWRLGSEPFLDGLRVLNGWALAAAVGLGALTTMCSAWRWSLVAEGLGIRVRLPLAIAHCYRSVFLNAVLPGGVLGDVDRAVRHGSDAGDLGRGARTVFWERSAGQAVQIGIALVVLSVFASPIQWVVPLLAGGVLAAALTLLLLRRALRSGVLSGRIRPTLPPPGLPGRHMARWRRAILTARADIRNGVLARRTWLGIVLASAIAVTGHLAMFVVAARATHVTAPLTQVVPLVLLALLAMALPLNIGGWGPREGVAAWAFAAGGLGADQGITTAVAYGALVLVASLPGAVILLCGRRTK